MGGNGSELDFPLGHVNGKRLFKRGWVEKVLLLLGKVESVRQDNSFVSNSIVFLFNLFYRYLFYRYIAASALTRLSRVNDEACAVDGNTIYRCK